MEETSKYNHRLDFIDMAKGLAIICIILGHYYSGFYPILGRIVYPFHVPIFFLISGFFFKIIDFSQSPKIFIKKKIKTLLFPYFYSCIIIMIVSLIQDVSSGKYNDILINEGKLLFSSIYGGGQNALYPVGYEYNWIGVLWFLPALFESLVFTYLILYFIKNKVIQILCVLFIFTIGVFTVKFIAWQMPFVLTSGMTTVIYVYIGYLLSKINISKQNVWIILLVIVGMFGWCIAIKYNLIPICSQAIYGSNIKTITATTVCSILSSVSIILLMWYCSKLSERPRFLEYVGRNSLIIMCVHAIELRIINWTKIFNGLSTILKLDMTFKEQMLFRMGFIYVVTFIIINIITYMRKCANEKNKISGNGCRWNSY